MKDFVWLIRYGNFYWHWRREKPYFFGMGTDYYDGPIWYLHLWWLSIYLAAT